MQSNQNAHEMLMRDIYHIGQVLSKKYTNLRLNYGSLVAFTFVQFA